MAKEHTFAAIDVGTTKVCTLVGEVSPRGDTNILGVGVAPSHGLRKGMVVDLDEATAAIGAAVEAAERSSGYKIVSALVSITGGHIASVNNRGVVAISRPDRLITPDDVTRVLEAARAVNVPANREILHVIPRGYILDGQEGVKKPLGMRGFRLDVEAHIITGATTSIQNLVRCINSLGIVVDDLVFQPMASSAAVLTDDEKEMGVVLADIGGGTTDIAIFIDGAVWYTKVLLVGGYQLTNDVAIGLRTPFATAERLKIDYGHALPDSPEGDDAIAIQGFGGDTQRTVLRRHLCQILHARAAETMGLISMEIKRSGYEGLLPAGLVLTGGSANLRGIERLASESLGLPARVGRPSHLHGLTDMVRDPAFATSMGLLLWGLKHAPPEARSHRRPVGPSFFRQLTLWVKELLPQ